MPYPNEHAARLQDPGKYVRFRRKNDAFGSGIDAIYGVKQDGTVELQAIRFDKSKFTVAEAKKWLKDHDHKPIRFEPASGRAEDEKYEYREMYNICLREDGGKPKLVGYAALFNSRSANLGGFVEQIAPGAFMATLKDEDIRALVNHLPTFILGRTTSGTLSLKEDDRGLYYEIDPPDTTYARDVIESMRRGDIDGASFGFRVRDEKWTRDGDKLIRTLTDVKLRDVSIVTFPAYSKTSASVRALWPDGKPEHIDIAIAALDPEKAPNDVKTEIDHLLARTRIREIESGE